MWIESILKLCCCVVDIETIEHHEKPESITGHLRCAVGDPPLVLTIDNDRSIIINDKPVTIVENFIP